MILIILTDSNHFPLHLWLERIYVPATWSAILKMIKETDSDDYETARSLNQELTFQDTERFFAEENIPLGQKQKRTLRLISEDGVFINLGLLLFMLGI